MIHKINASAKLYLLVAALFFCLMVIGNFGIREMKAMNQNISTLQADRLLPVQELSEIRYYYTTGILSTSEKLAGNVIESSVATNQIEIFEKFIDSNWKEYKKTYLTNEESKLVEQTSVLKGRADTAIAKLKERIQSAEPNLHKDVLNKEVDAAIHPVISNINELIQLQIKVGANLSKRNDQLFKSAEKKFLLIILASLLLTAVLAFYIIKDAKNLIGNLRISNNKTKEAEEKWKAFIKHAGDAIFILDEDLWIKNANDSASLLLGYSLDEFLKMKFQDIIVPEEMKNFLERWAIINKEGGSLHERKLKKKDGSVVDTEINVRMLKGTEYISVVRDISERKKAESRIVERESLLTALFNNIEGSIALYDANKKLVLFNSHFAYNYKLLTNHNPEVGHDAHHFLSEEAKKEPSEMMDSALKGNKEVFEKNYFTNGKMICFRTSFNPVINDGKVTGFTSFSLDLTKSKEAELKIRERESQLSAFFENIEGAASLLDAEKKYVLFNNRFIYDHRMLTNQDPYVGQEVYDLFPEEIRQPRLKILDNVLKGNKEIVEVDYLRDSQQVCYRTSFNPVITNGKVTGISTYSIDLSKSKEAEIKVRESEEKFRLSFMTSQDAFYIGTLDEGKIIDANNSFYDLFGYTREESIGKTSSALKLYVYPEDRAKMVSELKANGNLKDLELTCRKKNGELMIVSLTVNVWHLNNEHVIMAVIRDITERKTIETELIESREHMSLFVEHSPASLAMFNNDMRYIATSRRWMTDYNLGDQNIIGKTHYEVFPEVGQEWKDIHQRCLKGAIERKEEDSFTRLDGTTDWLKWEIRPWHKASGKIGGIIMFTEVITEQKESELKFKNLVEKSLVGVYIIQNGKYVYVNPKFAQTLGYTQEEMLNIEHITEVVDDSYKPDVLIQWRKKVEAGIIDDFHIELKYKRKNGEVIWAEAFCGETLYKGAKAIIGTLQDITERKNADTFIKEQAETFAAIIENANESILLLSEDLKVLQFNKTAKDRLLLNSQKEIYIGADFKEFLYSGTENIFMSIFNGALAGKYSETESCQTDPDGKIFWLRTRMYPVYDSLKKLIGITVLSENITERKKATELFKYQFENSPDIILIVNRDLTIESINRSHRNGPSVKELIGQNSINVLPEESQMIAKETILKCFETGQNQEIENQIRSNRWISSRFVPIAIDGVINQLMIIGTDITEKRAAQIKLQQSEERHRSLIENIGDAIILLDANGNTTYRSPSAQNVTGFATEELEGKTIFDTVHPDDLKKFKEVYNNTIANMGVSVQGQYRIWHKSGGYVWVEGTMKNLLNDKAIHAIIINYRNISERKKFEEQQLLMSSIVNSSDDAIISKTLDGIITSWNKGAEKVLGYSAEEVIGKHISIIMPTELHNEEDYFLASIHKGLSVDHYETRRIRKDKVMIYASLTISPIMNSLGKVVGASKILRDITERKIAEEKIKKSEADYRQLFDLSPAPMWVIDNRTHKFIRINKACINNYGYEEEEFKGMTLGDISLGNAETYLTNILDKKIQKNPRSIYSFRHRKKSGEQIDVVTSSIPVVLNGKNQLLMIAVDVTEKSLYEKNLTRAAINAQEDERYEIGAELHDNVCQILAASMMFLGLIKKSLSAEAYNLFDQTYQYITLASDEIRNLSHRLAPVFVEDSNLENAFDRLLQDFNIEKKYTTSLKFDEATKRYFLNRDLQLNLYRILQEQLRNISKYAEATTIDVKVSINHATLRMKIADNGVGFNVKDKKRGIGLANMNRRAQMHSGKFEINSSVGKGCEVIIEIPISNNAN